MRTCDFSVRASKDRIVFNRIQNPIWPSWNNCSRRTIIHFHLVLSKSLFHSGRIQPPFATTALQRVPYAGQLPGPRASNSAYSGNLDKCFSKFIRRVNLVVDVVDVLDCDLELVALPQTHQGGIQLNARNAGSPTIHRIALDRVAEHCWKALEYLLCTSMQPAHLCLLDVLFFGDVRKWLIHFQRFHLQ